MGSSKKSNRGLKALIAAVCAPIGIVVGTASSASAASYSWNSTNGGLWSDTTANGWNAGNYPNAIGDIATISQDITVDQTLDIDVPDATVGQLTFGDSTLTGGVYHNWTIGSLGGNLLTLNNSSSAASVTSNNGANTISAGIALSTATPSGLSYNGTTFNVAGGTLSLLGGFAANSGGYTLNGGILVVGGTALNTGDVRTSGTLRLASATGLGSGALYINSGTFQTSDNVLGPNGFTRAYGTGAGQFNFQASGSGISAFGGNLTFNIGGSASTIVFPTLFGSGNKIALGSATANGTINWKNPIQLTSGSASTQFITALAGVGTVPEGDLQGGITEDPGFAGSIVIGTNTSGSTAMYGTIVFSVANSYTGSTQVSFGTLRISNANALSNGNLYLGGYSTVPMANSRGVIEGNNGASSFGANGFTRGIGTGAGQVAFDAVANGAGGGFSAWGSTNTSADNLTVNIGGSGAQLTWGSTSFAMPALAFGSRLANATVLWQNPINLGGSARTINVIQGVGTNPEVDMYGVLSGAGGITKAGSGTLRLLAANTYTGTTTTGSGVVLLANALALQSSTVSVGGTNSLKFTPSIGAYSFGGLSGAGTFALADTGNTAVALTVGSNNASTSFSGSMTGGGSLNKNGTGTLTLGGSSSYSGATSIANSTVVLDFSVAPSLVANILPTTTNITLSNAVLNPKGRSGASSAQTVGNLTLNAGGNQIVFTPNSGTGLALTMGNTWTRNGNGTLYISTPASGTTFTSAPISGGGQTVTSTIIPYVAINDINGQGFGTVVGGNIVRYSVNPTDLPAGVSSAGTNYRINGNTNYQLAQSETVNSLTLTGSTASILYLNGKTLSIASGGLLINGTNTGNIQINGGVSGNNAGGGQIGAADSELIIQNFTGSNGTAVSIGSTALLTSGAGSLTYIGNPANTKPLIINSANAFTGPTSINSGVIQLGNGAALQNSPVGIWAASGLKFTAGLGSAVVGGLTGTGTFALSDIAGSPAAVNLSLGGPSTATHTYSGAITGLGGLSKLSATTQILQGTNTFAGNTTVSGGTLVADNNAALSTTAASITSTGTLEIATGRTVTNAITLNGAGATLKVNGTTQTGTLTLTAGKVMGTGTINQAVTIGSGLTIAPGNSIGTLTTTTLTIGSGGTYAAEADLTAFVGNVGSTAVYSSDTINASSVTLGGDLVLTLVAGPSGVVDKTIVLINNTGGSAVTGTFANITPISQGLPFLTYQLYTTYNTANGQFTGGNDVAINFSSVPEPTSLGLIGLGIGAVLRRRKRRSC